VQTDYLIIRFNKDAQENAGNGDVGPAKGLNRNETGGYEALIPNHFERNKRGQRNTFDWKAVVILRYLRYQQTT